MASQTQTEGTARPDENNGLHGFTGDADHTSKQYYFSLYFIGSFCAIGMGLLAGVAGFGYAAPILGVIDADIGPSPYLTWVAIVYTLCVAVGLTLVGRLTDLFGRRYFFIGGSILGTAGSIVCATAGSINTLIGGTTLIGLGAATQLSFHFVTAELVPMRARFWSVAIIYCFSIPGSGFGPIIAQAFVSHTSVGWRGVYYLLIGINVVALACWTCFYWPPHFSEKNPGTRLSEFVRNFDYVGTLLYTAGLTLFLMGISVGGLGVFPWKSGTTLGPLIAGGVCLIALAGWVMFANPKEPLIPRHIITNGSFVASAIVLGLGAAVYYAFAVVWPQMVAVLYSNGDALRNGWLSSIVGACFIVGQVSGGVFCKMIGKVKYQVLVTMAIGGTLLACMATCTAGTLGRAIGLLSVACVLVGWTESVCLTLLTVSIDNQQEIGTAGGIGASIRSGLATVCQTIYLVVLSTRLTETIPSQVVPAAVAAGLPESSVVDLLTAFTIGTPKAFEAIPGISDTVLAAATAAYKNASSDAYHTVFLTSIAFSGIAVVLALFIRNVDDRMTADIATKLHHGAGLEHEDVANEKAVTESMVE
ncbi:putative MFS-type transporter YusP [Cyphellophora attinorum]|uniref:Putative MFS-type transporter YusP n=1 Tax=Cyphellophora attinorum TaxID=1664694 RepID=A0A0N0NJ71_9EURO|nr:putative MFS-type transporter YusP [Phialophora attinorum]KPI36578.1 putative MFS-type transporter YusP [Phialophora attinorum]